VDPVARFLQGPQNSCQIDAGAATAVVGDPLIATAGLGLVATDGARVIGVAGEDFAVSGTKYKMDLLVPGSIWLFQKASGTTIVVDAAVAMAASLLVDGGTAADYAIGYRVPHAQEDSTHVAVRIEHHILV